MRRNTTIIGLLFLITLNGFSQIKSRSELQEQIGQWTLLRQAVGDLDNDGDDDIILAGRDTNEQAKLTLFERRNTDFISHDLPISPTIRGAITIGDLNSDGLPDILVSGVTNNSTTLYYGIGFNTRTTVLINKGGLEFEPLNLELDGFFDNTAQIIDLNKDGKADIFLSGATFDSANQENLRHSKVYIGQGDGIFSSHIVPILDYSLVKADWSDVNSDGLPDLVYSGWKENQHYFSSIYFNNGQFNLTSDTLRFLTQFDTEIERNSHFVKWYDMDKDGTVELIQTTSDNLNFFVFQSETQDFIKHSFSLPGQSPNYTFINFGDLDKDGQVDLLLRQSDRLVGSHSIFFGSDNYTNNKSPFAYNILADSIARINSFGLWEDFNADGILDILNIGQATYDGTKSHILFSEGGVKHHQLTFNDLSRLPLAEQVDIDNDGYIDLIAGPNSLDNRFPTFYMFKNMGGYNFNASELKGIEKLYKIKFDVGDYDKDGLPDLFITGQDNNDRLYTALYKNTDNNSFSLVDFEFRTVWNGDVKYFDYDHDGDLDLFYTGSSSRSSEAEDLQFNIYKNIRDSIGYSAPYILEPNDLQPIINGSINFVDLDNDSWEELIVMGSHGENQESRTLIYSLSDNKQNYILKESLRGFSHSNLGYGDLNNNGRLDLFISGIDGKKVSMYWYENTQNGLVEHPIPESDSYFPIYDPIIDLVDYNLDGHLDIIISGILSVNNSSGNYILLNNGQSEGEKIAFESLFTLRENGKGFSHIIDIDLDGDPDIVKTGTNPSIQVHENIELFNNRVEINNEPINELNTSVDGWDVTISWAKNQDPQTSYFVFIDDGTEEDKTIESLIDLENLRLKVGKKGLMNTNYFQLVNLKDKTYSVRILGVNQKLQTTMFSEVVEFEIKKPYSPTNIRAQALSDSQIKLTWNDLSFNEDGYEIFRVGDPGNFNSGETEVIEVDADTEEYIDTGLESGKRYHYKIRAIREDFKSDFTNPHFATTLIVAGVDDPLNSHLKIYPNPSKSRIYIIEEPTGLGIEKLTLLNAEGILVAPNLYKSIINSNQVELRVEALKVGTYIIKITLNSGKTKVLKMLIN